MRKRTQPQRPATRDKPTGSLASATNSPASPTGSNAAPTPTRHETDWVAGRAPQQ